MAYLKLTNLVDRFSGREILQLGWPERPFEYLGEAAGAAALPADFPAAVADDVALARAEEALYHYDGTAWSPLTGGRVDAAIADAGATIDGYLGGRYRLPLSTVPRALTLIAADLARYYLYDDAAPEQVASRRQDAIRYLTAVGAGRLSLGVDDAGGKAEPVDAAELRSGGNVWDRSDTSFI